MLAGALILAVPARLAAQEPPLAGRPAQFSNVVGAYAISASAEPVAVPVEEPITLRVTISGKGPAKYQPTRKDLMLFPASWTRDFYVEPVPAADRVLPAEGAWEFVYRLRPKHQGVTAIDGIKLVTYQPPTGQRPGRYQTAYAEAIAITVKPRPAGPEVPDDLPVRTAPASFYELPEGAAMLAPWPHPLTVPAWLLVVVLLAPPLLTVVGWRVLLPGSTRRREHSRAARRALQALAGTEPVWVVLGGYLRERLDFPAEEPTPAEVRRFLRRRGAARPIAEKLAAFVSACDTARFAGPSTTGAGTLRAEAGRLIHALEDDLCTP
jgi:hypothetical protein